MGENVKTITMKFSASIVLYKSDFNEIKKLANDIFKYQEEITLFLVDNSPENQLETLSQLHQNIQYIHLADNPGFGSGHNKAIEKAFDINSNYHFVVNPDILIEEDVFTPMIQYMEENGKVGMMMPQILNEDGTVQNLPKLLPSPFSIILRKFKKPDTYYKNFINEYELRYVKKDLIYNVPILSGCFTLLRMDTVKEIGMYDDRFFMYFEDWDLSRRINQKYKTIYFPKVSVIHGYESGANKNSRLFKIFVNSAISYFNKWGWFFDKERKEINRKTLSQFQ